MLEFNTRNHLKKLGDNDIMLTMDVQEGDTLVMKKSHPCGENKFLVLRSGMDFRIRCLSCGREVMLPRVKCEKNIKQILREKEEN